MSISLMTLAWQTSLAPIKKMALLAMCDWANDDGASLHPSVRKVAQRLSCSERQAQRVLHSLIEEGWLDVVGNANGGAPGQSRRYQINIRKLDQTGVTGDMCVTGDKSSRVTSATETGDICDTRRVTSATKTGDMGVTQTVIDPSIDPSVDPSEKARARRATRPPRAGQSQPQKPHDVDPQVWDDWIALRKAKRAPVTPTVLRQAEVEAAKADMTLEQFLRIWCARGTQGLLAEWLRPSGRVVPLRQAGFKSARQSLIEGAAAAIFEDALHV